MTRVRLGRGAGPRRPALLAFLPAAALALTGCAVGAEDPTEGAPPTRLSSDAKVGEKNRRTRPVGVSERPRRDSERASSGRTAGRDATEPDAPAGDATPVSDEDPPARARWSRVVATADPAADHGRGPTYADLRGLDLSERDDRLRITLTLDGVAPARLAVREVQGVGIDFFTTGGKESDHQVVLDGGDHGWRGYLQTPDGFVRFPGTLELDGPVVTVTLPWDAVGGRRGTVSAFVDWSAGTSMLSTDGTEKLPLE